MIKNLSFWEPQGRLREAPGRLLVGSGDGELMVMDKLSFQPTMVQSVLGAVTSIAMDSAGSLERRSNAAPR